MGSPWDLSAPDGPHEPCYQGWLHPNPWFYQSSSCQEQPPRSRHPHLSQWLRQNDPLCRIQNLIFQRNPHPFFTSRIIHNHDRTPSSESKALNVQAIRYTSLDLIPILKGQEALQTTLHTSQKKDNPRRQFKMNPYIPNLKLKINRRNPPLSVPNIHLPHCLSPPTNRIWNFFQWRSGTTITPLFPLAISKHRFSLKW